MRQKISFRRFFSQVLFAGLILLIISCAKKPEEPNFGIIPSTSASGNYEYFFKVVLPENISLTRSQ